MSPMPRGRIVWGGLLIVMALISLFYSPTYSFQGDVTLTPFRRSVPTSQPLGAADFAVTIYLEDAPLQTVIAEARAAGLSELETFAVTTLQWLRIASAQQRLIVVLTAPPFNAVVLEQNLRLQNAIQIRVNGELVSQIENLPGVVSVRVGGSADLPPRPTIDPPPRDQPTPGTRVPPLEPPSFDSGTK